MKSTAGISPEISRMIEHQLRNWELAKAQRVAPKPEAPSVQKFVAISRQAGSGGRDVANLLAQRLAWPLFDREILQQMAGSDQFRKQLYESMDEHDAGWLERILEPLVYGRFVPGDYFHMLAKTILALARGAPAVFLGRAVDLILPHEGGLTVRIVAPFDQRVKRFSERQKLDLSAARKRVAAIDQERREFIREHFQTEIDDPTRCDLTINMARLSPVCAVEAILASLRARWDENKSNSSVR